MAVEEIAQALAALGCPAERCAELAAQLDKRAGQLAILKNRSRDEAVVHLLRLMAEGWAAQAVPPPGAVDPPVGSSSGIDPVS